MLFREFITESLPVFLLEYNREKTIENWGDKLQRRIDDDSKMPRTKAEAVVSEFEKADPTLNKQYVQWIIKAYINGSEAEDLTSRGKDNLEKFETLKKKKLIKPEHADIGKFKNLINLEDVMEQYELPEEEHVDKGDITEIENNEEFRALIPHNEKAACYYGQGTRWCTAAKNDNMFKRYDNKGDLIIIIPKKPKYKGEKYQVHFNPFVMMDEKDKEVYSLSDRFKTFDIDKITDKTLYGKNENVVKDRIIKNNMSPRKAVLHALNVLHKRWPEAESIIAKDPYAAYHYATDVIKGRWPEGEETILKDNNLSTSLVYARDVIKGRWPEAEEAIMQSAHHAFYYAKEVIGDRWKKGEEVILKDPEYRRKYSDWLDLRIFS